MIADALAEETAQKSADEKRGYNPFNEEPTVAISLKEYRALITKAFDYNRLINAIITDAELNYNHDALRIRDDNTINAFKVLLPDLYFETLRSLKDACKEPEGE